MEGSLGSSGPMRDNNLKWSKVFNHILQNFYHDLDST